MEATLSLSEKLYLLGIHPEKGGIVAASQGAIGFVLAGATLLELHKSGNIKFENKRVIFINAQTSNATHKFLLDKIRSKKSPKKIGTWISNFNNSNKKIRQGVQNSLADKRIIRMKQKQFLFFKWKSPTIVNKSVVFHLIDDVKECIFRGTSDKEKLILLSLILPGKLQHRLYSDRSKRREASKKLKVILQENPVSKSVQQAIEAAQAVAASVAATTVITSS